MAINKKIKHFSMDLSPLPSYSSSRLLKLKGDNGAEFIVEVRNEDNKYYNFYTNKFQVNKHVLDSSIGGSGVFQQNITFPIVGDDDQYDIFFYAKPGTEHADYKEVRFPDGSIDINSSVGSNSLMIKKVIYQYTALTLTISPYDSTATIEVGSIVNNTISVANNGSIAKQAFSLSCAVTSASKCYQIKKQPQSSDVISFLTPAIGAAPITIEGENIYPAATAAFTGDDINGAVTSGAVVRMDNTDLSAVIKVGDKITTPVITDTVNGAVTSGIKVVMDNTVAAKMAVGDQITGNAFLNANLVTVAALNPDGDNDSEFSMSEAVALTDGITLTFSSKINRSLTTVTVVETSSTATDFTMSQAIQFRDNAPLTFFNQMNYQWPINNFANILKPGMIVVPTTNITAGTAIGEYKDTITEFLGTKNEKIIVKKQVDAVTTLALKPVVTKGVISTQAGAIVFNKQQTLALAGGTVKTGGYGQAEIKRIYGWGVIFSDLKLTLNTVTTTTTAAVNNSTSVPVTSVNGILDDVSTVSGIGINPSLANPTVDTGAGAATGAGTLVLTAAQTIENGATLTFAGAGQTATITGNIEIVKAGGASQTLRFDVGKLLSIT